MGAKILGAEIRFLDQHNQNMQVNPEVYDKFNKLLMAEKPDVVFGMWPLEFHPDHRAAASISFNAWLQCGLKFEYFFCETASGGEMQTQQFIPNRYIEIDLAMKRKALETCEVGASGAPPEASWRSDMDILAWLESL